MTLSSNALRRPVRSPLAIAERYAQHAPIFLKIRQFPDNLLALLNDASLYLQALERGFIVLTLNLRDFDDLNQLLPAGRVLFYAPAWRSRSQSAAC